MTSIRQQLAAMLPEIPLGERIPRLIHQMYPHSTLPDPFRENVEEIIRTHPGWTHRLYDDDALIAYMRTHYGQDLLDIVERLRPCYGLARADLFRYLLVYREGGVYLDIKSRPRDLEKLLVDGKRFITAHWGTDEFRAYGRHRQLKDVDAGELQQWHVISVAGHPFLREVILTVLENVATYSPWRFGAGKPGVLRTTGPIAYTRAILSCPPRDDVLIARSHLDLGLEYSVVADHKVLFPRHYTTLRTPLVVPRTLGERTAAALYQGLREMWIAAQPAVRALRRARRGPDSAPNPGIGSGGPG